MSNILLKKGFVLIILFLFIITGFNSYALGYSVKNMDSTFKEVKCEGIENIFGFKFDCNHYFSYIGLIKDNPSLSFEPGSSCRPIGQGFGSGRYIGSFP